MEVSSIYKFERQIFSNRPSNRSQIWHACAHRYSHLNRIQKFDPPHPRGVILCCSFVPSFVRVTAVLAAKRAERHDRPRTITNDRPRTTTHARPRTATHDHACTTAHNRPRTTDHGCHICLRKRYPPHSSGV